MEPPSSTSRAPQVSAQAASILARAGIMNNPYFKHLEDGSMTRAMFQSSQEQFFFAVTFFPRPMAALVGRIDDPHLRLDILGNLVEEHGEFNPGAFHHNTFKCFLGSIHANVDKLDALDLWPEVRAFNSVLTASCVLDAVEVGVGCMGIIEHAFAGISARIGNAVVARGWVKPENLVHYKLHVVEPQWNDPSRRYLIIQGLELGAYIFDRLYRDLFEKSRHAHSE
jgi:pyrroloquinoline-quinone synthase